MSSFSDFYETVTNKTNDLYDAVSWIPSVENVINIHATGGGTPVSLFGHSPMEYKTLYPKVLMACEVDQVALLLLLYPKYAFSYDVVLTWLVLIRRGLLPQLLETGNKTNVERFMLVNAGISAAFEAMEQRK
jgi:hypothetical protein